MNPSTRRLFVFVLIDLLALIAVAGLYIYDPLQLI